MWFSIHWYSNGWVKAGSSPFVVAPAAVAVHVDHHVAVERRAEVQRQVDHLGHRLGLLAVDVEDRDLQHLGDVGGVGRRAALLRRGREADLVVDHHVDRAAHRVAGQLAQVERLLHDPFADEGRVAVDQDRHAPLVAEVGAAVLLGPRQPQGHRVDELQVAGIEAEREVDLAGRSR